MAKVVKAFNSVNRRFKAGDVVTADDLGADEFNARKSAGLISDGAPQTAPASPKPAAKASDE